MEVRERHTPSRGGSAAGGKIPGTLEDVSDSEMPVYRTNASGAPHGRASASSSPPRPRRRSDLWEGELESEEFPAGSYGSREKLTKKEMMQEPWTFPVQPVFPSGSCVAQASSVVHCCTSVLSGSCVAQASSVGPVLHKRLQWVLCCTSVFSGSCVAQASSVGPVLHMSLQWVLCCT